VESINASSRKITTGTKHQHQHHHPSSTPRPSSSEGDTDGSGEDDGPPLRVTAQAKRAKRKCSLHRRPHRRQASTPVFTPSGSGSDRPSAIPSGATVGQPDEGPLNHGDNDGPLLKESARTLRAKKNLGLATRPPYHLSSSTSGPSVIPSGASADQPGEGPSNEESSGDNGGPPSGFNENLPSFRH